MPATAVISRQLVVSSNIHSIGWDASSRTLEVAFHRKSQPESPSVYRYANVPPEVWQAFLDAESKGRFFKDRILRVYDCTKVS